MDDVRHAAEERAARPKKAPVGSSFESERQREKNALVRQLDAQDGRNVHKISAAPEIPEGERVTAETYTRFPPLPKYRRASVFCVSRHIAVCPPMILTRSFPSIFRYSSI